MMQEAEEEGSLTVGNIGELSATPPGPVEIAAAASEGESTEGATPKGSVAESSRSEEDEQKAALINQVLELQNTLDELSGRVNRVKEENAKLKSENEVLTQYIENLMASSTVIQSTTGQAAGSAGNKKSISSLWSSLGGKKT